MSDGSFTGRYVFVAGLHRTGTSLVANLIASHSHVAGITASPAPEDEGCYLQGAIPHTALHGIPGHYATDQAQHLTEGCEYDSLTVRDRITSDWNRWFTPGYARWRLEKSPVNLTRMRLYQQLFPMAQFVIIVRHPSAMAAALAKWSDTPASALIDHALDAHDLVGSDLQYLHAALVLRYEDLVAQPDQIVAGIFAFLGLDATEMEKELPNLRDGNADYPNTRRLSSAQEERAARWGYSDNMGVVPVSPIAKHPLRAVREDTMSILQRLA